MALAGIRRKLDVDILVSGHTHQNEVVEHDGCFHINPVSFKGIIFTASCVPHSILKVVICKLAMHGGGLDY